MAKIQQLKTKRIIKMTTTNTLKTHSLAEAFPMADSDAYTALVADIKEHGLREPITLFDGKVLDGRNRLKACIEAGIEPKTKEFEGDDPEDFVHSANINRRHLTQSWLAITAAAWIESPPIGGLAKKTTKAAAARYGIAVRVIERARRIVKTKDTQLIMEIKSGKTSLRKAEEQIKEHGSKKVEAEKQTKKGAAEVNTMAVEAKKTEQVKNKFKPKSPQTIDKSECKPNSETKPKGAANKEQAEEKELYSNSLFDQHMVDAVESLSGMKSTIGTNALTAKHEAELNKLIAQAKSLIETSQPELKNAA